MIELYQGDCLEVLKNLPENSIDLLLTDPPYGIDFQSKYRNDKTKRMPKILNDKKPFTDFIPLIKSKIAKTGGILCFTRWDVQQIFIDEFICNGLKPKNVLIWDKKVIVWAILKRHSAADTKVLYGFQMMVLSSKAGDHRT